MSRLGKGSQVKWGVIFSYVLIVANALYGFVITPLILKALGTSVYGVYKTVGSLSSAMMVLDFGLGGTMMRYIARYRVDNEQHKIQPFVSMALCEAGILILVVSLVSGFIYLSIDNIYAESFSAYEVRLAEQLFLVLAVNMAFHILENVLNGVITGYNNFIFGNGIKLARLAARAIFVCVVLLKFQSAMALVLLDLAVTVATVIIEIVYIKAAYCIKIKLSFKAWDWAVFKESFVYTVLLFLTSLVVQLESNIANIVIGAFRGPEPVAVYSFGVIIFQMFMQLSTAVSGVMLPTVTQTLKEDENGGEIQRLIIRVGRIQFALLSAALAGFAAFGQQFIKLWLGSGFEDVYIIVLLMIVPTMFELCINMCLTVLRAKNMLGFRTIVICISALMNLLVTVVGVKFWNYKAAAIGTGMSYAVGGVIVMCVYYYKKLGFNMLNIYGNIFNRLWICTFVSGVVGFASAKFIIGGWLAFIVNAIIFCVVYVASLMVFGLSREEKRSLPIINRFFANNQY